MNNQSKPPKLAEGARAAFEKLQQAIDDPPIEELVAPIEVELGLRRNSDLQHWRDAFDDLMVLADLANLDALRELVHLPARIRDYLQELKAASPSPPDNVSSADVSDSQKPNGASSDTTAWRSELDEAAERLIELADTSGGALKQNLNNVLEELAPTPYSFPLRVVSDYVPPTEKNTLLVAEICNRLVQRRIASERRRIIQSIEEKTTEGLDLPPGWAAKGRAANTPLEMVRPIFSDLERMRTGSESVDKLGELHQAWASKAVLLPKLDDSSSTIGKWLEAALLWVSAQHNGDLTRVSWDKPIVRRIEIAGSLEGGLKRFLREGFETLAGKDRKNTTL